VLCGGLLLMYRLGLKQIMLARQQQDFVSAVSHELKTPLTSIRMYAEMLRDGLVQSDDKRSEYYHTITDESERLSRLIDNVLEFSRLERGESELRKSRVDLREVVTAACAKLQPHAERHGFVLREDLGELPLETLADPDAVTQIVFNVVDNALKYARDGGSREIDVACTGEGSHVLLRVSDHGPGLPPARRDRIFEPFYRGDEETARSTRGSGIGLALVRELAESMGGTARADDTPGGGLAISVRLPRAPSS
jgi:two-component system phosphate regulon sensor histidine kinase PhoR